MEYGVKNLRTGDENMDVDDNAKIPASMGGDYEIDRRSVIGS